MAGKAKVFGLIALLGFVAGVIAQLCATFVIPWFVEVLPLLGSATTYLISGVAGACLTVALVSAWAFLTHKKDNY
jgi:hypothetical protein